MSKSEKIVVSKTIQRKGCQATLAMVEKFVAAYNEERDQIQVQVRLDILDSAYKAFLEIQGEIEKYDEPEALDNHLTERVDFENRYCVAKGFLLSKRSVDPHESLLNTTVAQSQASAFHLRLPKIDLPKFDGDFSRWMAFRDTFQSMVHSNNDIPTVAKLQYLLQSLEGEAKKPFESIDIVADNYATAWDTLLRRYDNKRLLKRQLFRALYDLPPVLKESAQDLHDLVDDFQRYAKALAKLGDPVNQWDTPLTNMLAYKLDSTTLQAFEEKTSDQDSVKYEEMVEFLYQRVRILKSVASEMSNRSQPSSMTVAGKIAPKSAVHTAATTTRRIDTCCSICNEGHTIYQCPAFYQMSIFHRREAVSKHRLCWNCLSSGHLSKYCNSVISCRYCNERHHSLLHETSSASDGSTYATDSQQPSGSNASGSANPSVGMASCNDSSNVLLATVSLVVVDQFGMEHPARALLDSGSTSNLMSTSFANSIHGETSGTNISVAGVGQSVQINRKLMATIKARSTPFSTTLEFLLIAPQNLMLPSASINISEWKLPNLPLADPQFNMPAGIDLIIGCELYHKLHTGSRLSLGDGLPLLVETSFGWTITGQISRRTAANQSACFASVSSYHIRRNSGRPFPRSPLPLIRHSFRFTPPPPRAFRRFSVVAPSRCRESPAVNATPLANN